MEQTIDALLSFYQIDQETVVVILMFSVGAAYVIRNKLTNPASALILAPLFFGVAITTYQLALLMQFFSPRKTVEWITYAMFSAAIGAIMGILMVVIFRFVQGKFITAAHIRQTLKRDAEQAERGYPQVHL